MIIQKTSTERNANDFKTKEMFDQIEIADLRALEDKVNPNEKYNALAENSLNNISSSLQ